MSKIKNGDMPAIPNNTAQVYEAFNDEHGEWDKASLGLTKREYFAGLAMQGLLANAYWNELEYGARTPESVAIASKEYADALLKELSNEG